MTAVTRSYSSSEGSHNWLFTRVKQYQVITFTISFLILFRLLTAAVLYLRAEKSFLNGHYDSLSLFILLILVSYIASWWFLTWIASKHTAASFKDKLYKHPIATIVIVSSYIVDLPGRLAEANMGDGVAKLVDGFEYVVFYAVLSLLWWLLICWVSSSLWVHKQTSWNWYRTVADFSVSILPSTYRVVLGTIVAIFIYSVVVLTFSAVFNYSGADLKSFNRNK